MEQWLPVLGYDGIYEVSNYGNLRSLNYKRSGKIKLLLPAKDKKGYLRTALMKSGIIRTVKIHRIVAIAFIPNPENKPQVNHKDGIKDNNFADNLEWATNKENIIHAYANNLVNVAEGDSHPRVTISNELLLQIKKENEDGIPKRELARKYNFHRSIFRRKILNGK